MSSRVDNGDRPAEGQLGNPGSKNSKPPTPQAGEGEGHLSYISGPLQISLSPPIFDMDQSLAGRFELKQRLAHGKTSVVYHAFDVVRRHDVALKISTPLQQKSPQIRKLATEAYIARHASHPVRVIDVYDLIFLPQARGVPLPVLSMEFGEGGTFRDWLRSHIADIELRRTEGLRLFAEVCLAAHHLHLSGVIHHDLKPDNIILVGGQPKVTDFGIAAVTHPEAIPDLAIEEEPLWPFGTPLYMSPEQFRLGTQAEPDERSDIYSLGVILFELLSPTGQPPFVGSYNCLKEQHDRGTEAPHLSDYGSAIQGLVSACLSKDPAQRPRSLEQVVDELTSAERGMPNLDLEKGNVGPSCEELLREARYASEERDYEAAEAMCDQALALDSTQIEARTMLDRVRGCRRRADDLFREVQSGMDHLGLLELLELLYEAVEAHPRHPQRRMLETQLSGRVARFNTFISSGRQVLESGDWERALCHFKQAQRLNPGSPDVESIVDRYATLQEQTRRLRAEVDQAIVEDNLERALILAKRLDDCVDGARASVGASRGDVNP